VLFVISLITVSIFALLFTISIIRLNDSNNLIVNEIEQLHRHADALEYKLNLFVSSIPEKKKRGPKKKEIDKADTIIL